MQDASPHSDPLQLLHELERRCLASARGLPMQEETRAYWRGIGFTLGSQLLLAPLEQVEEILTLPVLTRVPLVKPWVLGIANVRGNLLPVMDLQAFLGLGTTAHDEAARVMAIRQGDFFSGLLVSAVSGLQQIDSAERSDDLPTVDAALRELLAGSFMVDGTLRPVFDFARLAAHGGFRQAAA
jgi:twitching motility protein PilI